MTGPPIFHCMPDVIVNEVLVSDFWKPTVIKQWRPVLVYMTALLYSISA